MSWVFKSAGGPREPGDIGGVGGVIPDRGTSDSEHHHAVVKWCDVWTFSRSWNMDLVDVAVSGRDHGRFRGFPEIIEGF